MKNNTVKLTPREYEVLRYLVEGYSYKQIANQCMVSFSTTNTHLKHIYKKLNVNSATAAVSKALREQILLS